MKAILSGLAVLAWVAASPMARADGGTTVTAVGADVTITVHIDLCCFEDAAQKQEIEPLPKLAETMWNDALAKLSAKGCYDLRVVFDVHYLNKGNPWEDGYHHITIDFDHPGRSIVDNAGGVDPTDDNDLGYTRIMSGTFYSSTMTTGHWAHEIAHLMGLADDYYAEEGPGHQAKDCLPNRSSSLMCHSRTGAIDENLANRLIDLINNWDTRVPQCWKGTMHSDSTGIYPRGSGICAGEGWDHEVKLFVDTDHQVSGKAKSKLTTMPLCTGPLSWTSYIRRAAAKTAAFDIKGQLSDVGAGQFELRFAETAIDGGTGGLLNYSLGLSRNGPILTVPLVDLYNARGVAETNVAVPMGEGASATGRHRFDLHCASCEPEPRPK